MADGSEFAWLDLTSRQRSIWLDLQATGNLANFQVGLYFSVAQKIDVNVLRQVLNDVVSRHDALRLKVDSDRPRQQLLSSQDVPLEVIDLTGEEAPDDAFRRTVEQRFLQPFPLDRCPLFEFLIAVGDSGDYFMMRVHHIITDGISLGLLLADIAASYNAKLGLAEDNQASSSYLQFLEEDIRYCASPRLKRDLEYWGERLVDLPTGIFSAKQKLANSAANSPIIRSKIEVEQYEKFLAACSDADLRPGNVIIALASILLAESTSADDLVLGVTFPGRSKEHRSTVGLFNGVLPVRVRVPAETSVRDLSLEITQQLSRDYLHYRSPLEESWKTATFSRQRRRYACDVLVSYIPLEVFNFGVDFAGQVLAPASLRGPEASPLAIYVCEINEGRPVSVEFAFNQAFLTEEEAGSLSRKFHDLIGTFIESPAARRAIWVDGAPTSAQAVIGGAREAIEQARDAEARDETFLLRVVAGFTADPIRPPLKFWADKLGFGGEVSIAPYNQVFQELLDPASPSRRNRRGANLVLLRLEDWARDRPKPPGAAIGEERLFLQSVAADFLTALTQAAAASDAPYIVMICPPSELWDAGGALEALQLELLTMIEDGVRGRSGVSLATYTECRRLYPVDSELDPAGDELGHLPYTTAAFSAKATMVARRLHLLLRPPIKVVVVDCDNTLWGGVVAEDGVVGLQLTPGHIELQSKLVELSTNGVLICLCSKNVESDVLSVFEQRPDMVLTLDHVIAKRINWNRKSENIASLASELNLGLDSFVFLDDNPVEIGEVGASLPQVLGILWESNNDVTGVGCAHLWSLDSQPATGEDKKRLERYRQNALRSEAQQASPSYSSFIEGLDLRIRIEEPTEADLPRLAQLTVRTNQFNLNGVRRSLEEIRRWIGSPDAVVRAISVADKFGDYGLVGMLAAHRQETELVVDTLLMSCRVLGRGVEHRIIAELGRLAAMFGASQVRIRLQVTERNLPIRRFLDSLGGERSCSPSEPVYLLTQAEVARCAFRPGEDQISEGSDDREPDLPGARPAGRLAGSTWLEIATVFNSAAAVEAAVRAPTIQKRSDASAFRTARNETERALSEIFCDMMSLERISIDDDFFDLGLHSLMAVQIVSRIRDYFEVRLAVSTIFDSPTIAKLSEAMAAESGQSGYQPIVPLQIGDDSPPLFCCHPSNGDAVCYMRLTKAFGPDQTVYGFEASGLAAGEPLPHSLEEMAEAYVRAMVEAYPKGPYHLLGWSFGGALAFEIARQLEAAGQDVAFVAFMDAAVPQAGTTDYEFPDLTDNDIDDLVLEGIAPHIDDMRWYFELPQRDNKMEKLSWEGVISNFQALGVVPDGYSVPEMRRKMIVFGHCSLLFARYQASKIGVPIIHYRARDNEDTSNYDWSPLASRPVETVEIDCNHFRMGFEPNVNVIAQHLRSLIRADTGAA